MNLVEFKKFSFRYLRRKKPALKDINLTVEEGTTVAVVGPAGAGKTTLVKALNGLVPYIEPGYLEGDVIVNGLNTREYDVPEMAHHVSIVLENPDLQIFSLTVKDDIAFGPANLGLPADEIWERVAYAMRETELVGFDDRNPNNLSGGEQQSLAIAGALAMKPRVLALDEPVAMLDPVGKERVMSVVERITKGDSKATTIITESGADIEAVAEKVDRVIALHQGEVVVDGPAEEVLVDPVMERIGVGRPQVVDLFLKLQGAGLKVPHIPIVLDDAVEILRRLLTEAGVKRVEVPPGYGRPRERDVGEEVVRVQNLHHTYPPDVPALRGIDLTIRRGEMVGIIGQNGSGKTTLARHLVGLLKPTNRREAMVQVMNQDITKLRFRQIIEMINYVFQNPDDQIFADTVWEEIAFAPEMMGFSKEKSKQLIEEALETFNLKGHERDYTMALPADLKTYLSIACVLPLKPQVLLIDEPTTGLDTRGERVMLLSLKKLQDAGHTIVIITHNMKTVAEHCDRVIVMKEGKILIEGPPREVYAQPNLLLEADIRPPQITQLGQRLSDMGFPSDVLTVDEMAEIILHNLGR